MAALREAGQSVDLTSDGPLLDLSPAVQLAAYRVVQEGLTNAVKHGRAARIEVRLLAGPDGVEISVCDDGSGSADAASVAEGSGYGLAGLRERVLAHGGTLETGPLPAGGFAVRAHLPSAQT